MIKKLDLDRFKEIKLKMNVGGTLKKCQYCPNKNLLWENLTCCYGNHVICQQCLNKFVKFSFLLQNCNYLIILIVLLFSGGSTVKYVRKLQIKISN